MGGEDEAARRGRETRAAEDMEMRRRRTPSLARPECECDVAGVGDVKMRCGIKKYAR